MNPISTNHSYDQIEEIVKSYHYSVRESVDPLHLHKYGLPLRKFTAKRDLVGFLNMKLMEAKHKEPSSFDKWAFSYDLESEA